MQEQAKELVDYITQYLGSVRDRRVTPDVKPGYMEQLLPATAPSEPEDWESIMPGVSPRCQPPVKDKFKLQQTFTVDPVYLRHENSQDATDFMHWQIPLSRRFRSIKLWFVLRSFGLKKLQAHVRHGIEMAKLLEAHVRRDPHFEIPAERHLGLVVFCLKGGNSLTQELLTRLTRSGTVYLSPADVRTKRVIRFTVTSQFTTADDILKDWGLIADMAAALLAEPQGLNDSDEPNPGDGGERKQRPGVCCVQAGQSSAGAVGRGLDSMEETDVLSEL
ncbi:histidine decarboxylase-like [Hippoglossus hippoglossus]|uniref:histidine decarboxylase-like n=1 Tax=Hippoglossus hippoglossus TaxID=8267 RepID=UPI00148C4F60|nr:histidine decarboxylase-like [Hippoglossus hippoglossus]